ATNKILAKRENQHDHHFATGRRFTFRMPLRSHPDCRATLRQAQACAGSSGLCGVRSLESARFVRRTEWHFGCDLIRSRGALEEPGYLLMEWPARCCAMRTSAARADASSMAKKALRRSRASRAMASGTGLSAAASRAAAGLPPGCSCTTLHA